MKKSIFSLVLLLAPLCLAAQERLNDTVIEGVRYAVLLDSRGDVSSYERAFPYGEAQAVVDLNRRLRSVAVYQSVAVPAGVAGAVALSYAGIHGNPRYGVAGESRFLCDRPGWAAFGVAATATCVVMGVMSYLELWTPRLYVNQDGLVFRLGGKEGM